MSPDPRRLPPRLPAPLRRFARARDGVAALEFALVTPVLILMFFGMAELGQGLIAARRATHACSALGDLVAQAASVKKTDLDDSFAAASDIMKPLSTASLNMRVTSVTGDKNGNPIVDWSRGYGGYGAYAKAVAPPVTLPAGLIAAQGDTIVLTEAAYAYTSPIGYVLPSGLAFQRASYLRPRQGAVTCSDC